MQKADSSKCMLVQMGRAFYDPLCKSTPKRTHTNTRSDPAGARFPCNLRDCTNSTENWCCKNAEIFQFFRIKARGERWVPPQQGFSLSLSHQTLTLCLTTLRCLRDRTEDRPRFGAYELWWSFASQTAAAADFVRRAKHKLGWDHRRRRRRPMAEVIRAVHSGRLSCSKSEKSGTVLGAIFILHHESIRL